MRRRYEPLADIQWGRSGRKRIADDLTYSKGTDSALLGEPRIAITFKH